MLHLTYDFTVSPMTTRSDVLGKAYVHYKSWRETYSGLIDPEYLRTHTLEKCERIAESDSGSVLVAKVQMRVVGFVCFGAYRDDTLPDTGEIYAIYLLKEFHDFGIGKAMMEAALRELREYNSVAARVLEGNERAIEFFERRGFESDGTRAVVNLGAPMLARRMIRRTAPV